MDFIEALPKLGGFGLLLVVVERLMKYEHFIGLTHLFTATSVAVSLSKEIVRLQGFLI